jgi:hypothetical protein
MSDQRFTGTTEAQGQRLAAWLRERGIDRHFSDSGDTDSESRNEPAPSPETRCGYDSDPIAPGQVRLVSNHLLPASDRPVYIAIYSWWKPLGVLAAPFSRYSAPAFPGELAFDDREAALRVLCLWNSFSLPLFTLSSSWIADSMTELEMSDARAVARHWMRGEDLSAQLRDRTGPPIYRADDPRLDYQREELALIHPLLALQNVEAAALDAPAGLLANALEPARDELSLAAASLDRSELCGLLFDSTADELMNAALAQKLESKSRVIPLFYDQPLLLFPGMESKAQPVQLGLKSGSPALPSGAPAWLLRAEDGLLIASGHVLDNGQVITFSDFYPQNIQAPMRDMRRLIPVVFNKGDKET